MRVCLPALSAGVIVCLIATPQLQTRTPLPAASTDAPVEDLPSVGEIMDQVMARAKRQDDAAVELGYESLIRTTVDSLNGDGEITKTETSVHRRYAIAGELYEELVERDGRPLTEKEDREEAKAREKFVEEVRKRTARGEEIETNDERQVRLDRDLLDRFQASVTGVETLQGEPAWVLAFEPRPGKLPENTRLDKALNRSSGTLYVSQQDHGVMRVEFEMQQPIRYLWGLMATLRHAQGQLEFDRVEPDVWLPQAFDLEIDLRILFRGRRQRVVREWVERHRVDGQPAAQRPLTGPSDAP